MAHADRKPSIAVRTRSFFDEVRGEMRKVTWPTRQELYGATIVIFIVTMVFAYMLGAVDSVFGWIMTRLFSFVGGRG